MEKGKTEKMLPSEWRIVSAVNGWLAKNWRRGTVPAREKAALCNSLLALLTSSRGRCDAEFLRLTDALFDRLDDIRHVRSNCTARFMDTLVRYVGEANAALDACGATCPRIVIPLRGGDAAPDRTEQSVRMPEEHAGTDRTLVPVRDITPVEIDTKGLGETTVRIVILDGKVTCDITQRRK